MYGKDARCQRGETGTARLWLYGLILFAFYIVVGVYSLNLAFVATNVSPIWPPTGVAVAALVLGGVRLWPAIAAGAFVVNVLSFPPDGALSTTFMTSATIAAGNTLEAVLAAYLINRFARGASSFDRLIHVFSFAASAVIACFISATIGLTALLFFGFVSTDALLSAWLTWWIGDVVGLLVLVPLIVSLVQVTHDENNGPNWGVSVALVVSTALISLFVFSPEIGTRGAKQLLAFLYVPCLAITAYYFGLRGVSLLTAAIAAISFIATLGGEGPFIFGDAYASLIALDCFLLLWVLTGMVLAADLRERGEPVSQSLKGFLTPWMTLMGALALTAAAWYLTMTNIVNKADDRFSFIASSIETRISDRMRDYQQVLRGAAGLFYVAGGVTARDWERYVGELRLKDGYPGIQGVGYTEYLVGTRQVNSFQDYIRWQGFPDFTVHPAGARMIYTPVTYLEPYDWRNQRAHGFDMFSEPNRRWALIRARDSGEAAISRKITLVQETGVGVQAGFLMYLPVYRGDELPQTLNQRRERIKGYTYSPFRMNDLMRGILGNQFALVGVDVFDANEVEEQALLYRSYAQTDVEGARSVRSSVKRIQIADHVWTVRVRALPAFDRTIDYQKAHIVLVGGILISFLLFAFVRALTVTRSKALSLANEMTSAWRASEGKFATLAESAKEAIFMVNREGFIQSWNRSATIIFGYARQDIVGRQWVVLVPPEQSHQKTKELSALARNSNEALSERILQIECVRKNGDRFPAEFSLSKWRSGDATYFGIILRDVTESRLAEQRLEDARREAEAASKAKTEFVANMSHEIRTPMNAMLGMTQILSKTPLNTEQQRYVKMVQSAGRSLLAILNDILDFSKIEAGKMTINHEPFSLYDLAASLASIMTLDASQKQLELAIGIQPDVPKGLVGDELRIRQVLINLLSNAIKFTEQGEVSLLIRLVERSEQQALLEFVVRDTGIGMSNAQMEDLFEEFTQADSSMTRRFGGTGLGLAITRRLIYLMEGEIHASSQPGIGSEFIVSLPLELALFKTDLASSPTVDNLRVLVVDDNEMSRHYLQNTLNAWCWQVDTERSAKALLDRVDEGSVAGTDYNVFLIDWLMPGTDGLELARALRQQRIFDNAIIILMLDAYAQQSMPKSEATEWVDAVLLKPVTGSELYDRIHEVLVNRNGRTATASTSGTPEKNLLQGCHLLLVEDNDLNQVVASGFLEAAGAKVSVAADGQEAVDRLKSAPNGYDLILMDVQMPVLDGIGATRIIREQLQVDLPILAMSAGVLGTERATCLRAGMNGFIGKPVDEDELIGTIRAHLRRGVTTLAGGHALGVSGATGFADKAQPIPSGDVNLDHLQALFETDPETRAEILSVVESTAEKGNAPLEEAYSHWMAGHTESAANIIHTLRGAVGTLGGARFAEIALHLEKGLRTGDESELEALWDYVRSEHERVLDAVGAWLKRFQKTEQIDSKEDPSASITHDDLVQLRKLLAQHNPRAQTMFSQYRTALSSLLTAKTMAEVEDAMQRLDYDWVETVIADLQGAL
ncbi:CHASE domain-containing protein [Marinobacter fonticola]|uniref:CHASE domain-containing protein n=1 Tax=Marinobacter fonticola TaxID=2603215 RepID=UPI0011E88EE5|nr:CHASE domain-containing protein [Marinobacter fonticola]